MGRLLSSTNHESKTLDDTLTDTNLALSRTDIGQGSEFTLKEANSVRASTGKVVCCDFSSDGKLLASGGHDKQVSLWYTETLEPKARLQGHSSLITDVRFSPRLPRLATSSFDKTVRVWEDIAANAGEALRTFTGHSSAVMALDFHPKNDDLLCSRDSDGEIRYWSLNSNTCLRAFNTNQDIMGQVRFEPRLGNYLAAGRGNSVSILDVETQACLLSLQAHSSKAVESVCWHPSGEFLASVTESLIRVWTLGSGAKGDCIHQLSSSSGRSFFSCAFHPVFPSVLVLGCSTSLELWDVIENRTVKIPAHEALVAKLAASNLSRQIASVSHDKLIKLWK